MITVYNVFTPSRSSSCHQTVVFPLSTQDFSVSLKFERSSKVHGRARRVPCSMCAVFSVARSHSYSSKYSINKIFHRNIAISSAVHLLRQRHIVHGLSCPLARLSSRLTEVQWCVLSVVLSHSLHLMTFRGSFQVCRK